MLSSIAFVLLCAILTFTMTTRISGHGQTKRRPTTDGATIFVITKKSARRTLEEIENVLGPYWLGHLQNAFYGVLASYGVLTTFVCYPLRA